MKRFLYCTILFLLLSVSAALASEEKRRTISLDGIWKIAEGDLDQIPKSFESQVPVPGLVDMSTPPFKDVGTKSELRHAFWYERKFQLDGAVPAVALLKISKAMFGTRVYLNGKLLGDHVPSFTPAWLDVHDVLRPGENEIMVRVGASRDEVPKQVPSGFDYEKLRFTPGIYDSVQIVLSGAPHIQRIQAVPDLSGNTVGIHAWILAGRANKPAPIRFTVKEVSTGKIVGEGKADCAIADGDKQLTGETRIQLSSCHLWSPEDPFLYEISARTDADEMNSRFGMRGFSLDPSTGRAVLNGHNYFMRGSNVTLFRFFEDSERGDKPWNEDWVRRFHRACKDMHWNSLRYCIGFPPEKWYEIADEEGILIQDEFPIWNMDAKPGSYDPTELAGEYKEWMQERWNHPCVVIWDACNETKCPDTGKALAMVRDLDYSNRPWDDGWSPPAKPTDSMELHPYHFQDDKFKFAQIANDSGTLDWKLGKSPIIVNEYGWLWLNRDGSPTALTRTLYKNLLGENSTTEQRRHLYARYLAAETEFWRSHRACAAVMHFCALTYSRPGKGESPEAGATCDHWGDLANLKWEPEFFNLVSDSFAPVGLMIDAWDEDYKSGDKRAIHVVAINDLEQEWTGTVRFSIMQGDKVLQEQSKDCELGAQGKRDFVFDFVAPELKGNYEMQAALTKAGQRSVKSIREFVVSTN